MSLAPPAPPERDQRDLLRTIAEGTAGTVGDAFLRSLARCLAAAFAADVAYVAELTDADPATRARILACWPGGELLPEGYEYTLADTPCEPIDRVDVISHPTGTVAPVPARRVRRPQRARRLPRRADARRRGRDDRLRLRALPRAGRRRARRSSRSCASSPRAPPPSWSAAATRRRCAPARRRSPRRARGSCTPPTRSAAGSGATCTTAPSSGSSCSASASTSRCAPRSASPERRRAPDRAGARAGPARRPASCASSRAGCIPPGSARTGSGRRCARSACNSPRRAAASARCPSSGCPTRSRSRSTTSSPRRSPTRSSTRARPSCASTSSGAARCCTPRSPTTAPAARRPGAGSGLHGLSDRLEALGGRLEVESAPGAGTRLRASIPIAPWRDGREPFIEFGYEGDGGCGRALDRADPRRQQDRLGLARPRVGPRRRAAADRPAPADHRPPRQPARGGRGDARRRAAVRPDRRGHRQRGERRAARRLEEWLAGHRAFYAGCRDEVALLLGEPGWRLTDGEPMVVTSFRRAE